jgi:hypothetical protein
VGGGEAMSLTVRPAVEALALVSGIQIISRSNVPPIADASATRSLIISANGINATVVLDGTRSSDADGDLLQYLWYRAGNANPIATGAVATVIFPVGTHMLTLVVSDGTASSQSSVTVEVITATQAVERLVVALAQDVSRSTPLVAGLRAAIASIERANPLAAINQLQAFQAKIQAQIAPLDPDLASSLIEAAQDVIDALNETAGVISRIVSLERKPDGKLRLKVAGHQGRTHVIQVSTNLMDWENVGVAADAGGGVFEYDDMGSERPGARFYRVFSP